MENLSDEKVAQFTSLKTKLQSLGPKIKTITEQGRSITNDPSQLFLFRGMYKELKPYFDAFNATWDKLIELTILWKVQNVFPLAADTTLQKNIERYYYEASAIYEMNMNPTNQSSSGTAQSSLLNESRTVRARLPQINLPSFNGNQIDWPLFRDTYRSLIHDEPSLSGIEKFLFLVSCLKDQPLALIKGIELQEANYEQAWKLLNDTYNDKRRLASNYLKTVLEFTPFRNRPSAANLKDLLTSVGESIDSFRNLKIPDADDFILFCLLLRCLDSETRRSFEKKHFSTEFPKYRDLLDFLRVEWRSLELTVDEEGSRSSAKQQLHPRGSRPRTSLLIGNRTINPRAQPLAKVPSCPVCQAPHTLYQCSQFRRATPSKRLSFLKNWNGCHNCLSYKHNINLCGSHRRCTICAKQHHTWLHIHNSQLDSPQPSLPVPDMSNTAGSSGVVLGSSSHDGEVLLSTAIIEIKNSEGYFERIRAVIDSGSQHSFITERCAIHLGLEVNQCHQNVSGIGQQPLKGMLGKSLCSVRPTIASKVTLEFPVRTIVVSRITGELPRTALPSSIKTLYKSYVLADEEFWKPNSVDFLLGADLFYDIITGRPIVVANDAPRLLPTIFGYIVGGPSLLSSETKELSSFLVQSNEEMKDVMAKFWEVEEVSQKRIISEEDQICEEHFKATHRRLSCGRYVVSLPLKPSIVTLVNPKQQALSRLLNLEFKLNKNISLRREYLDFMGEYLSLGHMKIVPPDTSSYTIPHHPVLKSQNGMNKLRVVFDASCHSRSGSLNDHMYAGPKLQLEIGEVISNFRIHQFVFTADIVKMYRQILLNPADRKYQHILWRFNPGDEIQEYELCTVTYGEKASAFLAQRTIRQLVEDEGIQHPLAARVLLEDIYVDDIATGASTISDAMRLKEELIILLSKGGFELSKWTSNCPLLLSNVSEAELGNSNVALNGEADLKIKVLGIQWDPKKDVFNYELVIPPWNPTKRAILSTIPRIYDPLGFISPVVFYAKVILQKMWIKRTGWDDVGPIEVCEKWRIFLSELHYMSQINIPRYFSSGEAATYQIVGFSDASEKGYSAVLYLRSNSIVGTKLSLLKAKTKLAPIKPMSTPRLELCGALLLTRLYQSCKALKEKLGITKACFFTDSQVVLAWLSTPPENLKTFVAHRVVEIMEITNREQWHFVSSDLNPADCSSRGLLPSEFITHSLWWQGPAFLASSEGSWPNANISHPKTLPEVKDTQCLALNAVAESNIPEWTLRFSSYPKLLRVTAYIHRFINAVKHKTKSQGPISVAEYRLAEKTLMKIAQSHLKSPKGQLMDSKNLRSLQPFIDGEGCIRVGGRLSCSQLPYDTKHPFLLPSECHLTKMIIDYYHVAYLHLPPTALRVMLQSRYWIIGARKVIRKRVFNCLKCFKAMRSPQPPIMGSLPSFRLEEGQVFTHVGVDFAGPFLIRESLRRKAPLGRSYLCLFICMVTKAVHLEVVSKCSTDAFLAAFERFISRRGKPTHMYSDCETNFVGAANRLREIIRHMRSAEVQNQIIRHGVEKEIKWSFNPPSAPHFGGLWEAGVKSCKSILYKIIGESPLTFEELATLFCRIESILNSRPLAPPDSDTESIGCLTPGHFLIGRPLTALPEEDIQIKMSTLQRWKIIQQKSQHFWNRWRMEYLHHLQQRRKWIKNSKNIRIGELVIIKEPHCQMKTWPLARVIETHPGRDGVVRVVTLKTATGTYRRPVAKLVPLTPINENSSDA